VITPTQRAVQALEAIAASERPEVWTHLIDPDSVIAEAALVEQRLAAGETLGLAGAIVAVKDNIDVAGVPTTAGCPSYAYVPTSDAACVARLRAAGAVVAGKTNMDQFATGLTGVRSPYGAVRDAERPEYVSGGSSSGSAVAVALGLADIGLATDTAGSGRVPAAYQGIVGYKPSIGRVPTTGVVPACCSFDCVSVLARSVTIAERAIEVMSASPEQSAPTDRAGPATFAIFDHDALSDGYRSAFAAAVDAAAAEGAEIVEIDAAPFIEAGSLLYGGAFIAERYAAVGEFIETAHPVDLDPSVRSLILAARALTPAQYAVDAGRLDRLAIAASRQLAGTDALLLPTAPFQPTIDAVRADPFAINATLGTYTTFCNLLDLCAVAIPAGRPPQGGHFGISLLAPSGCDAALVRLARTLAPGGHV